MFNTVLNGYFFLVLFLGPSDGYDSLWLTKFHVVKYPPQSSRLIFQTHAFKYSKSLHQVQNKSMCTPISIETTETISENYIWHHFNRFYTRVKDNTWRLVDAQMSLKMILKLQKD